MRLQRRTLFAASLGFFVVVLDTTIVNVALPAIGEDLDADLSELQWVVDAYVVVFAGLLLSSGALSDRIGVVRCYSLGMAAFAVASLACAAAPSLEILLAAASPRAPPRRCCCRLHSP
jgi:DHA2 family methylenomycin A resistance protein-like MFS transporter